MKRVVPVGGHGGLLCCLGLVARGLLGALLYVCANYEIV